MSTRTSMPPPVEARSVELHTAAGWIAGTLERCGPNYVVVSAPLQLAVGDALRVRIPATSEGDLTLDTVLRWIDEDGHCWLQVGSLRARELVALRKLAPDPKPSARLNLRRRGFRVDGRIDPFGSPNERTYPIDGIPIALELVNGEVEGVAIELDDEAATVIAWVDLEAGTHVALRVFEDATAERWTDRAMVVHSCANGIIGLRAQRSRW